MLNMEAKGKEETNQNIFRKKMSKRTALILWSILGFIIILMFFPNSSGKQTTPNSSQGQQMDGSIRLTDTKLFITNKNSFEWTNCSFKINGGYQHRASYKLVSNQEYDYALFNFVKGDGTRYSYSEVKPQNISAMCYDSNNNLLSGYWEL